MGYIKETGVALCEAPLCVKQSSISEVFTVHKRIKLKVFIVRISRVLVSVFFFFLFFFFSLLEVNFD